MAGRVAARAEVDACCPSVLKATLDADRADEVALGFTALADPVRLRALSMLAAAPGGEVCVCEFVLPLGKSQPTISHHMKILVDANLIRCRREGQFVFSEAVPETIAAFGEALRKIAAARTNGKPRATASRRPSHRTRA